MAFSSHSQSSPPTKALICKTLRRPQAVKLAENIFLGGSFFGGEFVVGICYFWAGWSFVCGYDRYRFKIYKHPGGGGANTNSMIHETEKQRDPFVLPPPFNLCVCVSVCKGASFLPNILPNSSTVPLP